VIDAIKAELEQLCPETVSCADVLAIAARDSVVAVSLLIDRMSHFIQRFKCVTHRSPPMQSGGPSWQVEVGRKDSRTASLQAANTNLPAPTSGVATLVQKFTNVGLSAKDMVALSGNRSIDISTLRPSITTPRSILLTLSRMQSVYAYANHVCMTQT
jgi:peroxidase